MWLTELGGVESVVFIVMAALCFAILVLGLTVLILTFAFRNGIAGTSIDFYINCGCLVLVVSILIPGLSSANIDLDDAKAICQFFPSVVTVGLMWVTAGLLVKASAVLNFYKNHYDDDALKHEWKPNVWMVILMLVDATVVLIWVIEFPPEASITNDGRTDVYLCRGYLNPEFQLGVSAYHAVILLLAAILVWPARYYARGTTCSGEMTSLILVTYNLVIVSIAGALLYRTFSASVMYATIAGLMQYAIFTTLVGLLVGKILSARNYHARRKEASYDKRGWTDAIDDPVYHDSTELRATSIPSSLASSSRHSSTGSAYLEVVPRLPPTE